MSRQEALERAYRIADWADDPRTRAGRERYAKALKSLSGLLDHPWLRGLRGEVEVLDLCSGRGIGGVALAKALRGRGVRCRLVMVDIRRDAIRDAERFAAEEGFEAEAHAMDACEAHRLGRLFDVVLIYGASLAHFDEWSFIRLLASATWCLRDPGVIVIEEMDRVDAVIRRGYREIVVERVERGVSISVHDRYDYLTGSYYRTFISLSDLSSATVPINFRSVAHVASALWLFAKDVDVVPEGQKLYFVLGRDPRRAISPEDLGTPTALRSGRRSRFRRED